MSTINGQKSVFLTPSAPVQSEESTPLQPATVDYETHVANQVEDAIQFAQQLARWNSTPAPDYLKWSESCRESEPLPEQTDAEKRAEAHELARLGDGALHCIAGHDLKWQQGGS